MRPWLIRLALVTGATGALEAACRGGLVARTTLPAPSAIAASLWDILRSGRFDADIRLTLGNVATASLLAVLLGFAGGVAVHALPRLRAAIEPVLASYYAVPTFMFYPVFIVFFGVGSGSIVAIAVLLAVVAMLVNTLAGLDRIPPALVKTARVQRLGRLQTALLVQLPATAPQLVTGVKLSVAYAFIGVIASEFILSGAGLGYAIAAAYNGFDTRTMYALMLLVIVSVTLVNGLLQALDRRLQASRSE